MKRWLRIGTIENDSNNKAHDSKQYRVYSPNGKATTLCGQGGGLGAKTGLYAIPINTTTEGKAYGLKAQYAKNATKNFLSADHFPQTGVAIPINTTADGKAQCIRATCYKDGMRNMICNNVDRRTCVAIPHEYANNLPIYEVENGFIFIKGEPYSIELQDGFYAIRKLTVTECSRLQTLPDNYCKAVSKSQAYKGLGNGWTAEVIIHILNGALICNNISSIIFSFSCNIRILNGITVNIKKSVQFSKGGDRNGQRKQSEKYQ